MELPEGVAWSERDSDRETERALNDSWRQGDLELLLRDVRSSLRVFTRQEERRAYGYMRRRFWGLLREFHEKLVAEGLHTMPGYASPGEAVPRLERLLARVDEVAQEAGLSLSWVAQVVGTITALNPWRRATLAHLESLLWMEPRRIKNGLRHQTPLRNYELLQLLLPEEVSLEEYLERQAARRSPRGPWSTAELMGFLNPLEKALRQAQEEGQEVGPGLRQESLDPSQGYETLENLLQQLQSVEDTAIHGQVLQEALATPGMPLKELLRLLQALRFHALRLEEAGSAEGDVVTAPTRHVSLALSALHEAGGLGAVRGFFGAYTPGELPGVDVALTYALHYEELKEQPPALWRALVPPREVVQRSLYGYVWQEMADAPQREPRQQGIKYAPPPPRAFTAVSLT